MGVYWKQWADWLWNRSKCSCGHFHWAHWSNGTCAHCPCMGYDNQQPPTIEVE